MTARGNERDHPSKKGLSFYSSSRHLRTQGICKIYLQRADLVVYPQEALMHHPLQAGLIERAR